MKMHNALEVYLMSIAYMDFEKDSLRLLPLASCHFKLVRKLWHDVKATGKRTRKMVD